MKRVMGSVGLVVSCVISCFAMLCPATLRGQENSARNRTVVVRAGHLLDVKTGKPLTNQTIIIKGDKIEQVGAGDQAIPKEATVIDLSNATVLPGLIDAHTHITFTPNFGYSRLGISVPR